MQVETTQKYWSGDIKNVMENKMMQQAIVRALLAFKNRWNTTSQEIFRKAWEILFKLVEKNKFQKISCQFQDKLNSCEKDFEIK